MEHLNAWLFYLKNAVVTDWYLFSLLALAIYGLYQYLLDYSIDSSSKTLPRSIVTLVLIGGGSLTIIFLSGLYLVVVSLFYEKMITGIGLAVLLGLLQGLLFLFLHLFRSLARQVFPNHVVLPITKTSILLVILASWFVFDEFASVTANKLVGLALIGLAIYLFKETESREGSDSGLVTEGVNNPESASSDETTINPIIATIYLAIATMISAAIALLAKYAVGPSNLDIFLFIFLSNYTICFAAFYLLRREMKKTDWLQLVEGRGALVTGVEVRKILLRGVWLGVFNLVAFACLLNALSLSDASIVIPIYSLYIVIPVLFAAVFQGEVLTPKTTVGAILSVAAVIILE